jgi:hypothetical protein
MKYVLVIGRKDDGKSSTMEDVCKQLAPTKVERLNIEKKSLEMCENSIPILNGSYVITVKGRTILVVAGAPTEQGFSITLIIKICIELNIEIYFALVSMRSYERAEGYDTKNELLKFGDCVLQERIWKIEGEKFRETKEWKCRIEKIISLVN